MAPTTTVTTLADECVDLLFDIDPLWPVILGIDPTRGGLGDVTEAAENEQRAALRRLVERAEALDAAQLSDQDRVTRDVIVSQARSRIEQIDSRLVEFRISDFFVGPAASLLTLLPMVGI